MSHFAKLLDREQQDDERIAWASESVEARVKHLEESLKKTQDRLCKLVHHLEAKFAEDIDDDCHDSSRIL